MHVEAARANQLAATAREAGAEVLEGKLRYPSRTGQPQLGDLDLGELLHQYRDRRLMILLLPMGEVDPERVTCEVCGMEMEEAGDCPRCQFLSEYTTSLERRIQERGQLIEDTLDYLEPGT